MMNVPRPLFYITSFFPNPFGATYSAIRLAQSLRMQGVPVEWVVHESTKDWSRGGFFDGFPVQSFFLTEPGKWRKLKGILSFSWWMARNRKRFDVFHIHGGGHMNLLLGGWVKFILPEKKVMIKCTMDGWDTPDGARRGKYGRLTLWIYRRFDGVVAMTTGQHKKLVQYGCKGKTAVIPNGTDCERFCPDREARIQLRSRLDIPEDAIVLCFIGCPGQRKGTDILFKTWDELNKRFGNVYILMAGDYRNDFNIGPEMREILEKQGLDPSVMEHPHIRRVGHVDDAERYLQASDLFVFPSRWEGFGTVQTEAMACGLPCLVNDLPGISSDIFPDESVGFRILENDVDEFVRIASKLIDCPELRESVGAAARQRVVDHFSLASVGRRYIKFYDKMLNAG